MSTGAAVTHLFFGNLEDTEKEDHYNTLFVANAPADIRYLLDEITRLQSQLAQRDDLLTRAYAELSATAPGSPLLAEIAAAVDLPGGCDVEPVEYGDHPNVCDVCYSSTGLKGGKWVCVKCGWTPEPALAEDKPSPVKLTPAMRKALGNAKSGAPVTSFYLVKDSRSIFDKMPHEVSPIVIKRLLEIELIRPDKRASGMFWLTPAGLRERERLLAEAKEPG